MAALLMVVCALLGISTALPTLEVIGGENSTLGEFPYVVSVALNMNHYCGGTIVAKQWVLTAAHCLLRGNVTVRYGVVDLTQIDNLLNHTLEVIENVSHPKWDVLENDLVLLKLEQPLNFTKDFYPAKLPQLEEAAPENQNVTFLGWGEYSFDNDLRSKFLQKIEFPVLTQRECLDIYEIYGDYFNETNICAGTREEYVNGVCNGDAGGPILKNDTIYGVLTYALKPCTRGPGVYMKVAHYVDWIKSVIGE